MFKLLLTVLALLALVQINQADNSSIEVIDDSILDDSEYEYDQDYDQGDDQDHCSDGQLIERLEDILLPEDLEDDGDVKYKQANVESLLDAYERLGQFQQNVTEKLSKISKIVINKLKDKLFYLDISPECMSGLSKIFEGINARKPWASKFISSQPDIMNSVLGQHLPHNKYDECLSIKSPVFEHGTYITGQYCKLDLASVFRNDNEEDLFSTLYPLMINNSLIDNSTDQDYIRKMLKFAKSDPAQLAINLLGFCLPKNCEPREITQMMNLVFYGITRISIPFDNDCDFTGKQSRWNITQLCSLAIIFTFTMAVLFFTLLDNRKNQNNTSFIKIMVNCFSASKTTEKLMAIRENSQFKCLAAFRVFFSFYVLLFHNYMASLITTYKISAENELDYRSIFYLNFWNMDIFMFLSGMAVFLENQNQIEMKKFNWIIFVIKRYCKMLPTIIAALLIAFLYDKISQGPFWSLASALVTKECMNTWYMPLTMFNNYGYFLNKFDLASLFNTQCFPQSWYLGANFQIYILSPIILIPLIRGKFLGLAISTIILAISNQIPLLINELTKNIDINLQNISKSTNKDWAWFYFAAWNYIPIFIIGIYLVWFTKNKNKINLTWSSKLFLIIISSSMTICSLIWKLNIQAENYQFILFWGYEKQIFLEVSKLLYLSGFVMIIYLCATGQLEWLNNILGSKQFQIMSKLSLQVYMLHLIFVLLRPGIMRQVTIFSDYILFTNSVFDLILTYLLSYVTYIIFIGPVQNVLDTLFFQKEKIEKKVEKEVSKDKIINIEVFTEKL